jgi:hypothetical protein
MKEALKMEEATISHGMQMVSRMWRSKETDSPSSLQPGR